jgi:hypothetical protein
VITNNEGMSDASTFERAYESFRNQEKIALSKDGISPLSQRESRLRELLFTGGLTPSIGGDGDLSTRFQGWTICADAPDDDPQWTALYASVHLCEDPLCSAAMDSAVRETNQHVKCVQAARIENRVEVTLGLLSDAEPSPALLQRAYDILVSALQKFRHIPPKGPA